MTIRISDARVESPGRRGEHGSALSRREARSALGDWTNEGGSFVREPTVLPPVARDNAMSVTVFADHVHEVVDLDRRGAAPRALEVYLRSIDADADADTNAEEQSALRMLARSLQNAPVAPGSRSPARVD